MPQPENLLLYFFLCPDLFSVSNKVHKTTSYITAGKGKELALKYSMSYHHHVSRSTRKLTSL